MITWYIDGLRDATLWSEGRKVLNITKIYASEECREALQRLPDSFPELQVMVTVSEI
jgi:hypothetical protein